MQQERLRISGFAGLNEAEIDLGRVNLFIGPQASGKSIAAKLLFFIKSFCESAAESVSQGQTYETFREERVRQFDSFFPPAFRSASGFRIEYSANAELAVIEGGERGGVAIHAPFWERMFDEVATHYTQARESVMKNSLTPQAAMMCVYERELNSPVPTPQLFIPDGRGTQSFFEELLKAATIKTQELFDPFMLEYQRAYAWANRFLSQRYTNWWEAFAEEMLPVLGGVPVEKDGGTYIRSADGRAVLLGFASSGQREVLPILKMLAFLLGSGFDQQRPTVYLEEPETHLFPESQIRIINLISAIFKRVEKLQGVITTHSPYVAASLNNLLYAGQLASRNAALHKAVGALVPEACWLKSDEFRAYRFGEGRVTSAIDPETRLLQADVIDSASDETGSVFDRLVELDARG
jgi:hypothetical protein